MRRRVAPLLAGTLVCLLAAAGCGDDDAGSTSRSVVAALPFTNTASGELPGSATSSWRQVFDDDFGGRRLDRGKWRTRVQPTTSSRQCATPSPRMVHVRDGHVVLGIERVKRRTEACPDGVFANAMIGTGEVTEPGFHGKYGIYAARVKFQSGRGQHGSFWLQGSGPEAAEVDVAEYYGDDRPDGGISTLVHQTPAGGELRTVGGFQREVPRVLGEGQTPSSGWHVWSVQWSPRGYTFRVDDTVTMRLRKNVSSAEEFMVLSLLTSDWELPALDTTRSTMEVDWVKAWQRR